MTVAFDNTPAPSEIRPIQDVRPVNARRLIIGAILTSLFGAFLGYTLQPDNAEVSVPLGFGAGFVFISTLIALADWRRGLVLFAVIVLAEDSLRKGLPNAPGWINVAKDIVAFGCYLSYFFGKARASRLRLANDHVSKILLPIGIWVFFVFLQMFNPGVSHPLVAISGLRTWVVYMPMMFLGAELIRDWRQVEKGIALVVYFAPVFLAVAMIQNWYGDSLPAWLGQGVFGAQRNLEGGGWLGYNESVFATPTLYAVVCVLQVCLAIGLLKIGVDSRGRRRWLWISAYCGIAGAYISGVRTGLTLVILAIICMAPLLGQKIGYLTANRTYRRGGLFKGGVVGLLMGAVLVSTMGALRMKAFVTSFSLGIVGERVDLGVDAVGYASQGFLGKGAGMAGASGRVMTLLGEPTASAEWVEWGGAVISYSFGTFGVVFGVLVLLWCFAGMGSLALENRDMRLAPLRLGLYVYLGAQMSWYILKAFPVLENGTMSLIFWISIGALMGMSRLDRIAASRTVHTDEGSSRHSQPSA
ncbi:hypothetical protein OAU50_07615 [Planctomycetota bacterium]|nr:hypothetical protein [Planctomycetota bacterium]